MIETSLDSPQAFHARLIEECAVSLPLGAYTDRDAAHYLFLGDGRVFARSHAFGAQRRLIALSSEWPLFSWDEREMAQESAVAFDGLPDTRPLRLADGEMPRAIVARGEGTMRFVVGPVHAGVIEPGRFTFSSGGETIVHLDAQLGYSHRGVEAALEGRPALEAATKVARICGSCSAARSYAYALALEQLSGVELSAQVELARLVVAELERIYNHLADLSASASGAGYAVGFARGMALKERAMRLCATATGHRLLFDAIVPGGMGRAVLDRPCEVLGELRLLERDVARYVEALFGKTSLISRWRRAGVVAAPTATACGAVGPAGRASGSTSDLRRDAPYGAYADMPPAVAERHAGDSLARCEVKREELLESFRLAAAGLEDLGTLPLAATPCFAIEPGAAIGAVEGPRGAELVCVHIGPEARIERLHVISASYRNWPIVARAMENNIVPDFPLVNKSFNLCYACADR